MPSPLSSARQCQEQENNENGHSDASNKEAVQSGGRVDSSAQARSDLLEKIRVDIRTPVRPRSGEAVQQCKRIIEGLRQAIAAAKDGDLRADLLNIAPARTCQILYEDFSLVNNRVVAYLARPHRGAIGELPPYGIYCFAIQLKALKLLAVLKDHSRAHEELYWRYLK
ncbi:hypothetical protein AAVH_32279, partial [Aphelenchoides avenae]